MLPSHLYNRVQYIHTKVLSYYPSFTELVLLLLLISSTFPIFLVLFDSLHKRQYRLYSLQKLQSLSLTVVRNICSLYLSLQRKVVILILGTICHIDQQKWIASQSVFASSVARMTIHVAVRSSVLPWVCGSIMRKREQLIDGIRILCRSGCCRMAFPSTL